MKLETRVALLRGVNVGGKNILPMSALVSIFHDAGCDRVRTYIQSGNVLFEAPPALAPRVPDLVREVIEARFGFDVPVVMRNVSDLRRIVKTNPFLTKGTDLAMLHVGFLMDRPARGTVAALDPDRSPPDQFAVVGREIYLRLPNGAGRSKLTTQYFDSRLETRMTVRNWSTTLKLLELAAAPCPDEP